ncbi:putative non-specific serine/threonine protein kinase [Helianthus anomalus]
MYLYDYMCVEYLFPSITVTCSRLYLIKMSSHQEFVHLQISLEEIQEATNDFADENLIGQGAFGKVYTGNLLVSGQRTNIASRRLHYEQCCKNRD